MDKKQKETDRLLAKPKLKSFKTEWDLKKHYYFSERDPQIEEDLQKTEKAYRTFAKKYSNLTWTKKKETIHVALNEYLRLIGLPGSRVVYYLFYRTELDSTDTAAERLLNKVEERLTKAANTVLFFELALSKLPKSLQKALLSDSRSKSYYFYLETLFKNAQYQLSEPEEKILNLKSQTSRSLWMTATQKLLNKRTIEWKGKEMPINGALMQFEQLPTKQRHQMWNRIVPVLEEVGEFAENELVALVLDKKTDDELRGYKKPYSATTLAYDSSDETLESLVSVVETEGYALANRFFKIKKKLVKKELHYIDRNEPIGKPHRFDLDTAVEIVRDTFYGFNNEYGHIFDEMLTSGQIDVWPKKGKGGGAFCSSGVNKPVFVMLNHNDSLDSLRTIAHEMGHAVHAMRSKRQPTWYEDHSVLTAETASTFFESLTLERLIAQSTGKEKLDFLHNSITDRLMTIVMCIARFKFELEMHETIRKNGGMSWKDMAEGLSRHLGQYAGPAIKMDYRDGLLVVAKVHYRSNFYQYSYSFGELMSGLMRKRYYENPDYANDVDAFLCAGESAAVEEIYRAIGIDTSKKSTFLEGLELLKSDVDAFEQLTRHSK